MDYFIEVLNKDLDEKKVINLLDDLGLTFKNEDKDFTLVARYGNEIIGTCSKYKNIMKCFGVKEEYKGKGISSDLINSLIDKIFEEGYSQYFIFTKEKNRGIFESLGAEVLYGAEEVVLLEGGLTSINDYLNKMKKSLDIDYNKNIGSIVMNCNPFTVGHRYLIEYASKKCDELIIFVVEEDKSYFSFKDRIYLIKEGTKDLKNVRVIAGGEYIISSATFPSYFIKEESKRLKAYTKIDGGIFGNFIAKGLNIKLRFLGEEPECKVTKAYNESLIEELKKFNINVEVIRRLNFNNKVISASEVRKAIKNNNFDGIKDIVPKVTWDYLVKKFKL